MFPPSGFSVAPSRRFQNTSRLFPSIRSGRFRGVTNCDDKILCHCFHVPETEVREAVRSLPDGQFQWERLQGLVYGARIKEARLIPGVRSFFRECMESQVPVCIVSHKTKAAHHDDTGIDLHRAAIEWMSENEFFSELGMGLSQDRVFSRKLWRASYSGFRI